ncbi:MAG: hypothetical protein ABIQ81_08465 [Novosphingobium sp.]
MNESDRILGEASNSLTAQRAGGRRVQPIGKRSAERRRLHAMRKAVRIALAVAAVAVVTIGAGLVLDGIGFIGLFLAVLATIAAVFVFATWPRFRVPVQGQLNRGDVKTLVGNTELWLESRRPALPAPAVAIVDRIGGQLDVLGVQLEGLDDKRPEAVEIRRLIGESLPDIVSTYSRIPAHLRAQRQAGSSPDEQLSESLGRISGEIEQITRDLAAGEIDGLAVRTRYLGYKYGEGPDASPLG